MVIAWSLLAVLSVLLETVSGTRKITMQAMQSEIMKTLVGVPIFFVNI